MLKQLYRTGLRVPAEDRRKNAAAFLILSLIIVLGFRLLFFTTLTVKGTSMSPSLHNGDMLLVESRWLSGSPVCGQIVIVQISPGTNYVKRVEGTAGDTVEIRDGVLYRNGEAVENDPGSAALSDYGPATVPKGRLFVLGDNRNNSKDSRDPDVGMIAEADVIGRAVMRLFPDPGLL